MSLEATHTLSVYQHLAILAQEGGNPDEQHESLNALPPSFRKKILEFLWQEKSALSACPNETARVIVYQKALQKGVLCVVKTVTEYFKTKMEFGSNYRLVRWRSYSGLAAPISQMLHNVLGDLTPKLQKTLDSWVDQGKCSEQRALARQLIIAFLKNCSQQTLNLGTQSIERVGNNGHLEKVEMSLGLEDLPDIFNEISFARLRELNLSGNSLKRLPRTIYKLNELEILNLSRNPLTALSTKIRKLDNLKQLNLLINQLPSIPSEIAFLGNLKEFIFFSENEEFNCLPGGFGWLQGLQKLTFGGVGIKSLPSVICELQNLEILDLGENGLTTLPNQISQLQKLKILSLFDCLSLRALPETIFSLPENCVVNLWRAQLSLQQFRLLEETCNNPEYCGPTFILENADTSQSEGSDISSDEDPSLELKPPAAKRRRVGPYESDED